MNYIKLSMCDKGQKCENCGSNDYVARAIVKKRRKLIKGYLCAKCILDIFDEVWRDTSRDDEFYKFWEDEK